MIAKLSKEIIEIELASFEAPNYLSDKMVFIGTKVILRMREISILVNHNY